MYQEYHVNKEQEICISCGLCCDGTLFDRAVLKSGEKGSLPKKIEVNYFKSEQKEFFRLPCPYHNGKCLIYKYKKAHVCSAYRCKLLYSYEKDYLSFNETAAIVLQAKAYRSEIFKQAKKVLKIKKNISFRELQKMLIEKKDAGLERKIFLDMLIARCNILDVLIIRHFKTNDEFQEMIVDNEGIEIYGN